MSCRQCQGIESFFSRNTAAKELGQYRKRGPAKTTRMLLEALQASGIQGTTLLDIGGGVGAIQHELLSAGASSAVNVDAAAAYIEVAQEEAQRKGQAERVSYRHGNFVDLASDIPTQDIVTLDRVICCYHDMPALVGLSAARAGKLYGLVYPREVWWMKLAGSLINLAMRVTRNPFRFFVHPTEAVDAVAHDNGLQPRFHRQTLLWQVVVYAR